MHVWRTTSKQDEPSRLRTGGANSPGDIVGISIRIFFGHVGEIVVSVLPFLGSTENKLFVVAAFVVVVGGGLWFLGPREIGGKVVVVEEEAFTGDEVVVDRGLFSWDTFGLFVVVVGSLFFLLGSMANRFIAGRLGAAPGEIVAGTLSFFPGENKFMGFLPSENRFMGFRTDPRDMMLLGGCVVASPGEIVGASLPFFPSENRFMMGFLPAPRKMLGGSFAASKPPGETVAGRLVFAGRTGAIRRPLSMIAEDENYSSNCVMIRERFR